MILLWRTHQVHTRITVSAVGSSLGDSSNIPVHFEFRFLVILLSLGLHFITRDLAVFTFHRTPPLDYDHLAYTQIASEL